MRVSRTALAGLLTAAVLAGLLGAWFASGWDRVRADQAQARAAPRQAAAASARALAAALDARLAELAAREDARPYYHYQSLFHDPRGAAQGAAVAPSPLSGGPDDPLVAAHFQIDARGEVTLPTLNDAVPELSAGDIAAQRRLRGAIAAAAGVLGPRGAVGVAVAMAPAEAQARSRVEVLEQQAYVQNVRAAEVYQEAKAGRAQLPAPDGGPVTITVAPLSWRALELGGAPALAAVRRVDTPDGPLTQGVIVRHADAAATLAAQGAPGEVTLVAGAPPDGAVAAPITAGGGAWHVVVDVAAAARAADARAAAIATAFVGRFVPAAVLAIACAALVVLLVARAERAAQERARFAAAAAHELRTPLAGLQLYGDMLADGLGQPERAPDYARRIAEEAARLGRVVSNVLDFSRLERGNLTVHPRAGDAAAAARDAVERARPALERAGATVEVDAEDAAPARFDPDALARILGNLLDNAGKYGRAGDDRRIRVEVRRAGERVELAVADAGPGVARGALGRLFRPFARGVDADGPPGLGLGLALSRSLARAMGGDLAYRGSERGAVFVVTLPRE